MTKILDKIVIVPIINSAINNLVAVTFSSSSSSSSSSLLRQRSRVDIVLIFIRRILHDSGILFYTSLPSLSRLHHLFAMSVSKNVFSLSFPLPLSFSLFFSLFSSLLFSMYEYRYQVKCADAFRYYPREVLNTKKKRDTYQCDESIIPMDRSITVATNNG